MRYAITSVDSIYPLNTKTEVLDMINRFSNIKEYFKEEVAKNLYEVANEMNIMIPNNSEIYRFISLKNESVDKSNVFECEYYYVSSSELEEDSTFDDISKMSKSINKAIERSDIFKSNTSLNPNSDDGKSFTTNLYSCIKIDGNTFGFIKIALLNVIYYNRYTFNYEIIKVIDFDINSIYKSQTSNNLDEEIDIENNIDFYYLGESTELQKKTLKDSDYGIPELKKFPMHDKKHVLLAIKFFNTYVGTKYEKELADNINKKIIEFEIDDSEIHMTKVNQFVKYYKPYHKETLEEELISLNEELSVFNEDNIFKRLSNAKSFITELSKNNNSFLNDIKKDINETVIPKYRSELSYIGNLIGNTKNDKDSVSLSGKEIIKTIGNFLPNLLNDIADLIGKNLSKLDKLIGKKLYNGNIIIDKNQVNIYKVSILNIIPVSLNCIENKIISEAFKDNKNKELVDFISSAICAPINEEICKLVSEKYIDKINIKGIKINPYNILFNICEFAGYAEQIYSSGGSIKFILVARIPGILLHTINHRIIRYGLKHEIDGGKILLLTIMLHGMWNGLSVVGKNPLIKKLSKMKGLMREEDYSLLNETQNNIVNMYHLSQSNLDNIEIKPTIPNNYFTKNGYEDNKIPRICFSKDIDGCLRALSQKCTNMELYVHVPIYQRNIKQHIVHPTVDRVPDCKITKEVWITVPVKMKCIGKIKVLKDRGDDGLSYIYGKGQDKHTTELCDWDWEWIEKYNGTSLEENYNILSEENAILENIFSSLTKKVKIDMNTKEFVISGFNFNKFLLRVKELYNHKGLENLFDKKYSMWSEMMFKREAINRKDMKIVNLKVPLFFALEMYKLFLDLSKAYKLPYYEGVSKAIFNKTWINKYLKYEKKYTDLSNLKNIKFTLKEHQRKFVSDYTCYKNIYDLEGYILTFKPGLGKTLTAISLAECLNKEQVIIVCPNTIKENWYYEIKSYFNKYENDKVAKDEIFVLGNNKYSHTNNTKYLIVNMESIEKIFKYVSKNKDTMIIVDESHNFKDYKNKRCKDLLKLKELCKCKDNLMMSGTPIKATPDEIIPSLRMIDPYFTEELAFKYEKSFKSNSTEISNIVRERFNRTMYSSPKDAIKLPEKYIDDLYLNIKNPEPYYINVLNKEIIRLFNINYENELADLNDLRLDFESLILHYSTASKNKTKRYLDFINRQVDPSKNENFNISDFRKELYESFLQQYVYNNPNLTNIDRKNIEILISKYIHIRNVAMGKAIGAVLPKARSNCYIDIFNENYKKIINMINNNTKKTIIFTSFVPVANNVCDILNKNGVKSLKIIGETKNNDRIDIINKFKTDDNIDVLVATTQTLSIGVTITEASQMFFLGTPYRDADFKQACDRIYRIGQTSDVHIYKVLLDSGNHKNITTRINDILEWSKEMTDSLLMEDINKTELADKVVGLFKDNGFNPKVSKKDLSNFIAGKESGIGGKSLCIAGLGNEYNKLSKTCSLINKEIKPLGAKISPDNYGTAFLKVLKEGINHNNWYYVSSKKVDLKKGSVDEDLTYSDILSAIKGSSLVHDLKMYHKENFYNKEHTGYLYKFDSNESKEGPYTPYYHGEINFTVSQKDNKDDFYDWKLISVQNESVEIQEIKPDKCPKCKSKNLQTYFKGEHFRIRCKDCKYELGKFSAEAVKNESSTAGVAVAPSIQGKSPYVNTYPKRDEENNIPKGVKNVKNVLDDFYSVREKPNMLSESLIPNEIFNEHPIFADTKTLFGYDRVRLNKDVFERYTEEFKRLGFNQEGKIFNPKSDCGEIIIDKNKNIKACILINKDYVVRKLPYNILYFIYVDDSICDEKHTKEVWLENLSNIAFNRYSCEFIEVDKSNKELIQYYVEDHYGFSVLDDNGKKLILTARTDLIESFNIVLTNNETLLNEEVESESKYNMEEYSLDRLGTSSGVYSKLGLWNPIVKIKGQNYRERCEAIIFNDNNEIFMGINVNRTRIPGGGTMPNIPIEEQLKEECREEVRINIKDINYIGCYKNVYTDAHKEIFDRRSDIENVEYEGALTYLFTAKYDSKYTGDINALDKDDLINEGRFYPISKILSSNIKNEWKVAIINYLAKNSMNDSYTSLWNRMTLDTNFLELVENNDNSTIKTEAYNILTEEENSSKLKAKRNKIEKLIYTTFNLLDSTGKNAEKYKEHYKSLSDKDFFKEIQSMLDDNKKNFYLEILPNVNEPSLKAVKETADYLDLELDNYIYYRNDGDNNEPVRSSYKVPVGGLTIKRLQQTLSKKNTYTFDINNRNSKTGALTGHDKIA